MFQTGGALLTCAKVTVAQSELRFRIGHPDGSFRLAEMQTHELLSLDTMVATPYGIAEHYSWQTALAHIPPHCTARGPLVGEPQC